MEDASIHNLGHTDSKGSDEYNLALFDRRAEAVRAWLASHGIKDAAITTEDRGESEPVAPNVHDDGSDNSEGRQLNRRAEFVVSSE